MNGIIKVWSTLDMNYKLFMRRSEWVFKCRRNYRELWGIAHTLNEIAELEHSQYRMKLSNIEKEKIQNEKKI